MKKIILLLCLLPLQVLAAPTYHGGAQDVYPVWTWTPVNTKTHTLTNTFTPTHTYTFTRTPSPTPTYTFTVTPNDTERFGYTDTLTVTPTYTLTTAYTNTPTYTPTSTYSPTSTYTSSPTRTPTNLQVVVAVEPTNTLTPTWVPSMSPSPTPDSFYAVWTYIVPTVVIGATQADRITLPGTRLYDQHRIVFSPSQAGLTLAIRGGSPLDPLNSSNVVSGITQDSTSATTSGGWPSSKLGYRIDGTATPEPTIVIRGISWKAASRFGPGN